MKIYVNAAAPKQGNGRKETPFKHINDAAKAARPGDEVIVAPGIYRESVDPIYAGTEDARITYRSETPLGAVITGAEPATGWLRHQDNVWVYRIDNGVFGNYNPYTTFVGGDWYFAPVVRHTGAVYLNDRLRDRVFRRMHQRRSVSAVMGARVVCVQMVYRAGRQ